jgi:hypothetical protein
MTKLYSCNPCKYNTNRKSSYTYHLKSFKHTSNMAIYTLNTITHENTPPDSGIKNGASCIQFISSTSHAGNLQNPILEQRSGFILEPELGICLGQSVGSDVGPDIGPDVRHDIGSYIRSGIGFDIESGVGSNMDGGPSVEIELEQGLEQNIGKNLITCEYCEKEYSTLRILKKHQKLCKLKELYLVKKRLEDALEEERNSKNKLVMMLEDDRNKILEEKNKLLEEHKELRDVQKDYYNLLKEMNQYNKKGKKTTINMVYIINNFKDAHSFSDLMEPEFTEAEKKMIDNYGPLGGTINILDSRCVKNISIEKRPFHCVDVARQKFILNDNDSWKMDTDGKEIMAVATPKVYKYCIDNINGNTISGIQQQQNILNVFSKTNQKKVVKELCDLTSINQIKITDLHN